MKSLKKDQYLSIMLIPASGKSGLTLRLPYWLLKIAGGGLILSLGFVLFSVIFAAKNRSDLAHYQQIKVEAANQQHQTAEFKQQLTEMKLSVEDLIEKEAELKSLVGEPSPRRGQQKKAVTTSLNSQASQFQSQATSLEERGSLLALKNFLNSQIKNLNHDFQAYRQKANENKIRFAFTPSIWPLYGAITSGFGWRTHPVTGQQIFHQGLDIPSWQDAPIKAAGDGEVKFAGWADQMGYMVVIDHKYGYRTVYAHTSKILIAAGQVVKKGQVIAQVGSTGLSTGPHLHYEVRRWNNNVDPRIYLDLDIRTASTRIWNTTI